MASLLERLLASYSDDDDVDTTGLTVDYILAQHSDDSGGSDSDVDAVFRDETGPGPLAASLASASRGASAADSTLPRPASAAAAGIQSAPTPSPLHAAPLPSL